MSQEQNSLAELIYALNETMVGKLDALNERIDKLESTLTDNALDLKGAEESHLVSIQEQLQRASAPGRWKSNNPSDRILLHLYSLIWAVAIESGIDPELIVNNIDVYFNERATDV